ncbi:MAG: hypothetical protein Q4E69_00045 [Bacilli bacterium]|nr:hypothetical protein [Bacilli bacterium]
MGDFANKIKKITSNKNTVTVLGVVAAIIVLYVAYIMRVNAAVSPISVPYATAQISPGEQITQSVVGTRDVPPAMLKGKVIKNQYDVINKYASANSVIPKGSLFYESAVVEKEQLPENVILDYPSGYVLYNMAVTPEVTYGNSMYPGNYIDIYLKAVNKVTDDRFLTSDADKMMLGKLLENIKILAVQDSAGKAVFADLDEQKTPAMLIFAVPEEYYILLKKAEFLSVYESTLIPVPTNESLKDKPGDLKLSSTDLKDWINKVTIWTDK